MAKLSATATMTAQQYGDWFEGVVQTGLDQLMSAGPTFFARLYDSRAASSFLPKQAGDFIGCHNGHGYLLEAKSSIKYESLAQPGALRALVKDHQALGAYLMGRAKGFGLFAFRSRASDWLEIWDGHKVREIYVTPRSKLSPNDGLIVSCKCTDDAVLDNFKYIFTRTFE